jgi:hypothetical protein
MQFAVLDVDTGAPASRATLSRSGEVQQLLSIAVFDMVRGAVQGEKTGKNCGPQTDRQELHVRATPQGCSHMAQAGPTH